MTDPLERAWARELELLALMAAPGEFLDVDPLELAERIAPAPPPPPAVRLCTSCAAEFTGKAWKGQCRRCYDTERRARR